MTDEQKSKYREEGASLLQASEYSSVVNAYVIACEKRYEEIARLQAMLFHFTGEME